MNKDYQLKDFNRNDQFELSKIFMMKLGFDFSRGRIDKVFILYGGSTDDIRIITRFNENTIFLF